MKGGAVFGHFLKGARGPLHILCRDSHEPADRAVLVVPPFAEEMNKSRRMVTEVALRLAATGIATVSPDLYGTGDSGGDFSDADWTCWQDDLRCVREWCDTQVAPITAILAIRMGCALATSAVANGALRPVERTVLWQPVFDGKRFLGQLLRLRIAANIMSGHSSETLATLRSRLAGGETVEVAGYPISGTIAAQLEGLALPSALPERFGHVHWMEIVRESGVGPADSSMQLIDATRGRGGRVEVAAFTGEPFWAATEIVCISEMVEATVAALARPSFSATAAENPASVSRARGMRKREATVRGHNETPLTFSCQGAELVGIVHHAPDEQERLGILVIVGGPQYRVGSHRQFVLMARSLAAAGCAVLRFDYRGMGDSAGEPRTFESVHDDIRAAIDAFLDELPHLQSIFVFGLCDAASAALMYGNSDERVKGLIIANPWVRTSLGEARTLVRHYYTQRLWQPSFWKKVLAGDVRLWESTRGLLAVWRRALQRTGTSAEVTQCSFLERMLEGLESIRAPILILISEHDLTAQEFVDFCAESPRWARACAATNVSKSILPGADHTFSSASALKHATEVTLSWLASVSGLVADRSGL